MSLKPILFNTEMVRAILDGRKTCTRRKIPMDIVNGCDVEVDGTLLDYENEYGDFINPIKLCQYSKGDILWVRETWQKAGLVDDWDHVIEETEKYYYAAGPETPCFDFWVDPKTGERKERMPWRPSIHMPKEAARIFLKVKDVRVERLQEITDDGAVSEGIYESNCRNCRASFGCDTCADEGYSEIDEYSELWDSTIKKTDIDRYGWEANPYVWVVEFERCEKSEVNYQ